MKTRRRNRRPTAKALAYAEAAGSIGVITRAILRRRLRDELREKRRNRARNLTAHDHACIANAEAKRDRRRQRNLEASS